MIRKIGRAASGAPIPRNQRNFRRALLASCAALAVTPTASFAQNLLQNPGFEINGGPFSNIVPPWAFAGPAVVCDISCAIGPAHSGNTYAAVGDFGGNGSVSQTVGVTRSGIYTFSFFYESALASAAFPHALTATITGKTVADLTLGPANNQVWLPFTTTVSLSAGAVTAQFTGTTSPGVFDAVIDDVSLSFLRSFFLTPLLPPNAPVNPTNVAAAIDGFINAGGTLPAGFQNLYNLTPQQLTLALTQASGEIATGTQQTTFDAMNLFVGVLTDPFIGGRDGATGGAGATPFAAEGDGANAYAANGRPRSKSERDAYAAVYSKAPPLAPFEQRWSVWSSGFGGSQTTDGKATVGSNAVTSRLGAVAVGADYRFSPFTLAGFALAGGGTNFSLANGLGNGRSDLFQAGAFLRHTVGPAYIAAALAYGWQDITTDRTVTIAGLDQLHAQFNANAYSGRVEGGYRFVTPWIGGIGITPYAAGQFTTFDLPAYAESVLSGANTFALSYASKSVTDTRSELGIRTDKSFALQDSILTLRGRFAWAHDYNPDRSISATFQTLPGASFVVNGAAQAYDSALTTASAELKWRNGWSAAATFEGEFSDVTRSYAGKGVVRYTW